MSTWDSSWRPRFTLQRVPAGGGGTVLNSRTHGESQERAKKQGVSLRISVQTLDNHVFCFRELYTSSSSAGINILGESPKNH